MAERSNLRTRFEPVITPLFRSWWRMNRSMTLGARGVAIDDAGRVLLVRHTYRHGWYLPGGGVESGETARDAVIREMAEEGGVEAIGAPVLFGFYASLSFKNDHIALYRVPEWRACAPLDNGEIAERGFFAPDDLPSEATDGTRRRVAEIFHGAEIGVMW